MVVVLFIEILFALFSAEIEQRYAEIMKQAGVLTINGQVCANSLV